MVRRVANVPTRCGPPQLLAAMGLAVAGAAPAVAAAGPVAPALIQRINTSGGGAPSTGCRQPTDAGAVALVPYSTDYVFLC